MNVGYYAEKHGWSTRGTRWLDLLTNHDRVLAAIADDPGTRIRDIAARCRLTERAVQKIISDLEQNGCLTHTRQGRSNLYRIEEGTVLRHPADAGLTVAGLLAALDQHENSRETRPRQGAGGRASGERWDRRAC